MTISSSLAHLLLHSIQRRTVRSLAGPLWRGAPGAAVIPITDGTQVRHSVIAVTPWLIAGHRLPKRERAAQTASRPQRPTMPVVERQIRKCTRTATPIRLPAAPMPNVISSNKLLLVVVMFDQRSLFNVGNVFLRGAYQPATPRQFVALRCRNSRASTTSPDRSLRPPKATARRERRPASPPHSLHENQNSRPADETIFLKVGEPLSLAISTARRGPI